MYKAIIMDLDGTLLSSDNTILPETKEKLLALEKQGIKLILASGRCYSRLIPYAKELEMDKYGGYLVEVDGISVYDMHENSRHVLRRMEPAEIAPVFTDLLNTDCEVMACFDSGFYYHYPESIRKIKEQIRKEKNLPDDFPWTGGPWGWLADMRMGYPNQVFVNSVNEIPQPVNKIQLMQEEGRLAEIYQDLVSKYGSQFEIFRTCPRQLEILPKGYSKGRTLQRLMDRNGWTADEVIAFGDGENDVSLFDVCKNNFAMGNAAEYVKEKAAAVTLPNTENGIVHGLKELGL